MIYFISIKFLYILIHISLFRLNKIFVYMMQIPPNLALIKCKHIYTHIHIDVCLTLDSQHVPGGGGLPCHGVARPALVHPAVLVRRLLNVQHGRDHISHQGAVESPAEVGQWHRGGSAGQQHRVVDLHSFLARHRGRVWTIWRETARGQRRSWLS